jgi:outer membrane protein assembly factor BamB
VQNGRPAGRGILAFDRKTGKELWAAGNKQAGYSSPILGTIDGIKQVILFDGEGCGGYDPQNGKSLWYYPFANQQKITAAQPLIVSPQEIFLSLGYNTGSTLIKVSTDSPVKEGEPSQKAEEVYRTSNRTMRCKFTSPVLQSGYIYGLNDGRLECLEAQTGKVMWTDDRRVRRGDAYGHGQILLADEHLIVTTEFGELVLVEANPKTFIEKARISVISGEPSWNNPCMANGIIYLRTAEEMAAYDLRAGVEAAK